MSFDLLTLHWTVLCLWALWIIIYWWGGIAMVWVLLESLQAARTKLDTALLLIIMALGQVFIGTGLLVTYGIVPVMRWADNLPVGSFGILLVLIGVLGSTYCRYAMRDLWTAATTLHDQHRVIDTGLWGIVRHPLYAFIFIFYFGTALVYSVWWEWLIFALMIGAHLKKLVDEEHFLRNHLPGYIDYQRRVRYRVFPGLW